MRTIEKSNFLSLPKVAPFHLSKIQSRVTAKTSAYLGVPRYLQESWLKTVQHKATPPSASTSVFDADNKLIKALFESSSNPDKAKILGFCQALRAKAQSELAQQNPILVNALVSGCKEQIAQIVFLAERDPRSAAKLLDLENIPTSLKQVQQAYKDGIDTILDDIDFLRRQHNGAGLQDSDAALSVRKPQIIAAMLMTSSGLLNLGLIDTIKQRFFNQKEPLKHFEKDLIQTLDILSRSPEIQLQLQKVSKPTSPFFVSNDLLRISLKLPPEEPLTDHHARLVTLAAILSDMRQGDVGSCFATSVSILMMGTLRSKVIADFTQIISQGRLTRSSTTDQSDFIPVLDIGDANTQNPIAVDIDGKIQDRFRSLWQSPGIIAACKRIGLSGEQIESKIREVIAAKFVAEKIKPSETTVISVEELVKRLIKKNKDDALTPQQEEELTTLALISFSAETNTPLLRAWESCLAAMAEAKDGNNVRQKIHACVAAPLGRVLPKSFFKGLTEESKKIQDIFKRTLDTGIQLRYDEQVAVKASAKGGDGHSTTLGAFVLHELTQGEHSTTARKVGSPEEFQKFVLNRLKVSEEVVNTITPLSESKRKSYLETIEKIRAFILKPSTGYSSFIYNALKGYDEENATLSSNLKNWEEFSHLPFRDATGDDNTAVFVKATGLNIGQTTSVRPKNAQDLLKAFIVFGRERAKADNFLTDDDPYQRYMADTPQHAFTLTPEDASVVSAMGDDSPVEEWIRKNIIKPGMGVANSPLTDSQKTSLINAIKTELIPKEFHTAFRDAVRKIDSKINTVHAYSKELVEIIMDFGSASDEAARSKVNNNVTSILIDTVLSASARKVLSSSVARIADTNWVDHGVKHIYFACFFDPVTNAVALGTINEDGSSLRPQDQSEWVTYVPWELYGVKLIPTLADHKVDLLSA